MEIFQYICSVFGLVDCNNFYASCQRAFNPLLEGKPIVVLSNNDGCVIARSNEAKPFVPMGAFAFEYQPVFKRQGIHVFSSNFALYGDMSQRIMNTIAKYSPNVEVYSIDEAFIDFSGFEYTDLKTYGIQLRAEVLQGIGVPISIGIAPTKALAKVANKIAKKFSEQTQSVHIIANEEQRIKALKWTKIEDVWGIGRKISARLKQKNIHNAYQFTQLSDGYVRKEFSVVGLRLLRDLQGKPSIFLEEVKNKKAIATTRSLEKVTTSYPEIRERIATFAVTCCEKLRKQNSVASAVYVFVRTNKNRVNLPQYRNSLCLDLPFVTDSTFTITEYALKAFDVLFKPHFHYKKIGVMLTGILPNTNRQLSLFSNENPKHIHLMRSIDQMNTKYHDKLRFGSQDLGKKWKMKQEQLSPCYTTNWNHIIKVS